jgi:tetratricopeptide (TPR) repeat protein
MSQLPDSLKQALQARNVIPFVGAGVSLAVKDKQGESLFPSWRNLLLGAVERLKNENRNSKAMRVEGAISDNPPDFLDAAKQASEGLGSQWYDYLGNVFDRRFDEVEVNSLELARLLWQLGSNLIVTTNYDNVLRWACPNSLDLNYWDIEAVKEQADLLQKDRANLSSPVIWHLHGRVGNIRNIILTPDGYSELYPTNNEEAVKQKYRAALETLKFLLASRPFLFVGFSFNDQAFGAQLKFVQELFRGTTPKHYVLLHKAEAERVRAEKLNIELIEYADHDELPDILRQMADEVGKVDVLEKDSAAKDVLSVSADKSAASQYNPENRAFYVPFRPKGEQVVGREDALQRVYETLRSGRRTNIGQAVSFQGLGGLGKTQLAVEYAYRYGNNLEEYPNGVIWLTIDQDVDAQLIDLAEKARWIAPISEPKDKLAIALHRLKTLTKCLIIYDNVESPDELTEYLPESDDIHLLATSRNELSGFAPISLELLTPEQSVQMLSQEAAREPIGEEEREAAAKIAEQLDGLPLALELAGAYLRYRADVSWRQYLGLFERKPKSAFGGKFLNSFTRHDADVYQTLQISEELLIEETDLIRVLDLLTWSGSSPMGLSLLCSLLGVEDEIELLDPLSLGVSLRFLQKSPDGKSYAIHRLVAQVRRESIPLEERKEWVETICLRLGDWFQDRKDEFNKLAEYESETEHLATWQKHALNHAPEQASRLLWLQSYPPYYRGRYEEARNIISEAIDIFETTKCRNETILAHLFNDFGSVSAELGSYQTALESYEKSLNLRQQLFDSFNKDIAASYNNLANAYSNLKQYKKSFNFYQKALEILEKTLGDDHPNTASTYNNIGTVYGEIGQYEEQLKFCQKALEIRKKILGERHPSTATSYNNTGGAYANLRQYEKSLEFYRTAMKIQEETLGENHPDTANCYSNIGFVYRNLGDNKSAIFFGKKSLELRQKILGRMHPHTFISIRILIKSLVTDRQKTEALELIDRFLSVLQRSHPEYKQLMNQRAWVLEQFKRPGYRQQAVNPHKNKKKKRR